MTKKHMKKYLTSFAMICTNEIYNFISIRIAKILKSENFSVVDNEKQPSILYTAGGSIKWYKYLGK